MEVIARGQITIWNYKDGDDAYSIILNHDTHAVACDPSGNALGGELGPSGKAVFALSAYKGATKLTMRYSSAASTTGICAWKLGTISGCTAVQVSGSNEKFYINTMTADSAYVEIVCSVDGKASITKRVTVVKQKKGDTGEPGEDGKQGCMLRPRGTWTAQTQYVYNDQYRDVVIHNNSVYIVKTTHTSTAAFETAKWEPFNEFINVATSVLLANKGYIDVLGAARLFVGDTNKSTGWEMTNGYIRHTTSGLTLTADGKLHDPDGLHLSVGGKTVQGIVDNAIDDVVISGVNILADSDNGFLSNLKVWPDNTSKYSYTDNDGWRRINLTSGDLSGVQIVQEKYINTEIGRSFTLSVIVRSDGTITSEPYFRFRDRNTVHSKDVIAIIEPRAKGTYRLWATCKDGLSDNLLVFQIMDFATSGASYVEFRYPQLEYSNKPTEWRESPDDIGAKLQVLDDRITTEVHSLDVANKNLLIGSDISLLENAQGYKIGSEWYVDVQKTADGWWRIPCPNGINGGEFFLEDRLDLLQYAIYTESIEMRSDADVTANLRFYSIYGEYPVIDTQQISLDSKHWRLIGNFKVLYDAGVRKIDVVNINAPDSTYVDFRFPMFTEGNNYVPWQPAPEDETETRTHITKHDSEIIQLGGEITQRVTKTEYNEQNQTIAQQFSEIRQTAESINLRVSELQGGTNLIPRASFNDNAWGWVINGNPTYSIKTMLGKKCLSLSGVESDGLWLGDYLPVQYLKIGTEFSVSFDILNPQNAGYILVGLEGSGYEARKVNIHNIGVSKWDRVSKQQILTNAQNDHFTVYVGDESATVFIKNVKIEYGPTTTPYTDNEKDILLATGIDIFSRHLVLTADNTVIQDNTGTQIAMFTVKNGKPLLKAENIDVDNMKVSHLQTKSEQKENTINIDGDSASIHINRYTDYTSHNYESSYIDTRINILKGSYGGEKILPNIVMHGINADYPTAYNSYTVDTTYSMDGIDFTQNKPDDSNIAHFGFDYIGLGYRGGDGKIRDSITFSKNNIIIRSGGQGYYAENKSYIEIGGVKHFFVKGIYVGKGQSWDDVDNEFIDNDNLG